MELDFDKEIDALLRKTAESSRSSTASGEHPDADAIAAFVAGGLPPAARNAYTTHLADCDRCRKMLVLTASFSEESVSDPSTNVAVVRGSLPWYKRFLRVPSLAYTMGALVLLLSGFIGFSVFLLSNKTMAPDVSRVYDEEPQRGGPNPGPAEPYSSQPAANTSTLSTSNTTSNSSVSSPVITSTNTSSANSAPSGTGMGTTDTTTKNDVVVSSDAPAAPPPAATTQPLASPANELPLNSRAVSDLDKLKPESKVLKEEERNRDEAEKQGALAKAPSDQKKMKDQAAAAAKAAGPRRDQQSQWPNTMDGAQAMRTAPVVRAAGGKKFEQRNGIWYDTSYRGEKTKTVRRGTEDYIKLDAGLRSAADNFGGTVVIVWSGKAYRIE